MGFYFLSEMFFLESKANYVIVMTIEVIVSKNAQKLMQISIFSYV